MSSSRGAHRAALAVTVAAVASCGPLAPAPHTISISAPPGASTRSATVAPEPAPPALRLPDDIEPTAYRVRWNLDANRDSFSGHVDIDVRIARATDHVWLNAV